MTKDNKASSGIVAATGAVLGDLAAVFGIPANTATSLFRGWLNRKAEEGRDILLAEIAKGQISDFAVATEDDAIGVIYRFGLAIREGASRTNLRLLARVIVGLQKRDCLFVSEFNKYAEILSRLSRDEILVIGTLHRYRKAEERRQGPNVSTHQFWSKFILEIVPDVFPSEEHVIAICCMALRSGLIITPRDFDSSGEYTTSPIMDEVTALTDFIEVLDAERIGSERTSD